MLWFPHRPFLQALLPHHRRLTQSASPPRERLGRSGLQREVLSLYRACLRAVRQKPETTREKFLQFTRAQFRQHPEIGPRDVAATEHLLRLGKRQYEAYSSPDVTDVSWSSGNV